MKKFVIVLTLVLLAFMKTTVYAQQAGGKHLNFATGKKINIGLLVYESVEAMDLNGPLDVFVKGNRSEKYGIYNIYTIAATAQKQLSTESGTLKIVANYTITDAPQTDILVIPGATPNVVSDLALQHPELLTWIIEQNKYNQLTMSVCTGALLLAKTGLLDNHKATTHQATIKDLKKHKQISVIQNKRFVLDGKFLTTAGVTSGIDGALQVVELIQGKEIADKIALGMVHNRNGDMSFIK
jgi:transcriptional regulator GlxA family with amidase domain